MSTKQASRQNNSTLKQGTILAVASVISRIIGMLYRSPMTAVIGDEGNALYSFSFEIYSLALILSSYSMPLAVSKLLSACFAKKEYHNGLKIYRAAYIFSASAGLLMSVLILVFADQIEAWSNYEGLSMPLRVLAPTIFVVAIAGTLRGFFQARKTMIPTAVSQLAEQIINAIVSVVAAAILVGYAVTTTDHAKLGAAGGTMGTLFGALSGVLFLMFIYTIYKPRMEKHLRHDPSFVQSGRRLKKKGPKWMNITELHPTISTKEIARLLAITILPIILSQAVYQSIGVIDGFLFGRMYGGEDMKLMYSYYSAKYRQMVNIPNAISSSLASSLIPVLVSAYTLKNRKEFAHHLSSTIKFNMIIAFPCAIGLGVLSQQILYLLYPTTDTIISGQMLACGSVAVIFYALSTVTNAALQGLDRMDLPLRHAAISLGIHVVLLILLLKFTNLGAYALVIGNITYPLVVCIMNWVSVGRIGRYRQEVKKTFLIPLLCSLAMGFVVFAISRGIAMLVGTSYVANLITVLISVVIAVLLYFVLLILLKGLTKEDMPDFPMGMRIYRVAKKVHLME